MSLAEASRTALRRTVRAERESPTPHRYGLVQVHVDLLADLLAELDRHDAEQHAARWAA